MLKCAGDWTVIKWRRSQHSWFFSSKHCYDDNPGLITHADWVLPPFLCVCFFCMTAQKPIQLREKCSTMKRGKWKPIYFEVKRSKSRSRVTEALPAWVFALLWVLAFLVLYIGLFQDRLNAILLLCGRNSCNTMTEVRWNVDGVMEAHHQRLQRGREVEMMLSFSWV